MIPCLRLPLRFDAARLLGDLNRVEDADWTPHYNDFDYGGTWRGAALRSGSGGTQDLFAMPPQGAACAGTPLLDRCPYFREVLASFACPLRAVRLLGLAPASFIREHVDDALDYEDGLARIHIPIQTNPEVEFYLAGERLLLEEGGAYYLNVNLPHRVNNRGTTERVHLVIDAEVNDWLRGVFARGGAVERSTQWPGGAEALRARLFRDEEWRERLRGIPDARDFEREAVRMGRDAGLDLHEGDMDAALRGEPGEAPAGWEPQPGWTPVRFFVREGEPWAEWIRTGERRFTEPFFEDTVRVCLREPLTRFSRCVAPLAAREEREPDGFIFHMSRCGSTLAAQMFAALERVRVIAEAPPVDEAIQTGNPEWVRRMVRALGRRDRRYVVKLDAWHVRWLPLIREAFPQSPWAFLYREPGEVLRSQLRNPGRHCIGAGEPGRHCAGVLAGICEAALEHREGGLFIDYRELPGAVPERLAAHFGVELSGRDRETMAAAACRDAKNPWMAFERRDEARDARVEELVRAFGLDETYRRLGRITPQAGAA